MSTGLPDTLLQFVEAFVPTYQSAEVLLFFAANPSLSCSPEEVVAAMHPLVVTVPAAREYAAHFAASGLLSEKDGRYRYGPSPDLADRIGELTRAYNEIPVTLVRAIYRIVDSKIQSFADAFKLRRDES